MTEFRGRFIYIYDGPPVETTDILQQACAERDLEFIFINPDAFDFDPAHQLGQGDLMYRPATSLKSQRVEQFLWGPGTATFFSEERGPYFACMNPTLAMERAGVPIARTIPCHTTDRELLKKFADRLGGFPLIVKMHGFSRGVGVMRVDSLAALYSLADYTIASGKNPSLIAYVPDAVHWRVVVVGDKSAAAYRNPERTDDFRTYAPRGTTEYLDRAPAELERVAVLAVQSLKVELGGVDVLEHSSGRLYVLEANFPCHFAQAQTVAGIDVGGVMLDYLLAKSARLAQPPA